MKAEISIASQLQRREERLLNPGVRASSAALAELIADDFIEIGSSGRRFSKMDVVEELKHEKKSNRSIIDFESFPLTPNIVLVVYKVVHEDEDVKQRKASVRSSIWKSMDGQWKIIFHQGTVVVSPG